MSVRIRRRFLCNQRLCLRLGRDRGSGALILLPTVQFLPFGFAIDTDVKHVPLAVLDRDPSPASRDLVRRLEATTRYDEIGAVRTYDEAERALREGRAGAVLVIPPGFAKAEAAHVPRRVQLLVDGSDTMTVASTTVAASGLAAAIGSSELAVEIDLRYNSQQISALYFGPGLVGVILTFTVVLMTALAIAGERVRGTIEGLIVSPVRPAEFIAGKLLPYVVIGYVQMTLILLLGQVLFGIHPGRALPGLYAVALLFIGANLAVGLVFSTIARTQGQAMQMAVFFLLPNILLSGFMFPDRSHAPRHPPDHRDLAADHFLRVVRGMVLKGAGFTELWPDITALAGLLGLLLVLATLRVRNRLA